MRTLRDLARRRDAAGPVGQAGRRVPHAADGAARADRRTRCSCRSGRTGTRSASSRHAGLTMYGQMTAGSWIYIGTQGILQGTYETLAECAQQRFGGTLAGTITLTAGLGGMGGAQPLAVTMNGGVALCVEVDPTRIERRIKTRYLDRETDDLETALRVGRGGAAGGEAVSIGLLGNCAEVAPELLRRGFAPRRRHRPDERARSARWLRARPGCRSRRRPRSATRDPEAYQRRAYALDGRARRGDGRVPRGRRGRLRLREQPARRRRARRARARARVRVPGVRAGVRPTAVLRRARVRSAGRRSRATRRTSRRPTAPWPSCSPTNARLQRWLEMASERVAFQGLPARICWLGYGERARARAPVQRDGGERRALRRRS